jgi:hypothetical protein
MEFVKAQLAETPEIATSELFEKAKNVDASVKKLSLRQFNARYPLQIKRKQSLSRPGRRRSRRGSRDAAGQKAQTQGRDAVRDVFLRFAADLSSAEERKDLVKVISEVDRYVDEAISAVASQSPPRRSRRSG